MKRKAMVIFCIVIMQTTTGTAGERKTPDQYWEEIKRTAAKVYKQRVILNPRVSTSFKDDGDDQGVMVGISFDFPLWQEKADIKVRKEATKFLQEGAELVKKLEASLKRRSLVEEEITVLQAIMYDEGSSAIKAYFAARAKLVEEKADERQYRREIEAYIEPRAGAINLVLDALGKEEL